jgi:Carboxypeptidase regulatory-like domain
VVACAVAALGACAEPAGSPGQGSGIRGHVIAAPTCPVVMEGAPCPKRMVQTSVTVLDDRGERVARVRTDPRGSFTLDLAPGDYVLTAVAPPGSTYVPRQASVKVEPDTYARVTLVLDTRLREPVTD